MRVVVCLRQLYPGKIGGLETYVRGLITEWEKRRQDEWIILVNEAAAPTFTSPGPWMRFETVGDPHNPELWRAATERHAPALLFSPLLTIDPVNSPLPCVVNIPDLQHFEYPGFFSREVLEFRHLHYPLSAKRAAAIVTLSGHARDSIIEMLEVPEKQVHAILLAAGPEFSREASQAKRRKFLEEHELPERFIYFPANFWPHKNHGALFAALGRLRKQLGEAPPLALSGFPVDRQGGVEKALKRHGLQESVHFLGYLPKEELPLAYQTAEFLVFPSLFEGFGLPVAEAFASGCAVACSSATSLPELAGDAALLFDPEDPADIAEKIHTLWTDDPLRRKYAESGRKRSRELTWRATADKTYEVFRKVLARTAVEVRPEIRAIEVSQADGFDPAALPSADEARGAILHFLRPGSVVQPGTREAVIKLFSRTGAPRAVTGIAQPANIARSGAARFDILRLKEENYLPLEALWVGPEAAPEFVEWLRANPGATSYEIWLRMGTGGAIGQDDALCVLSLDPAPLPVGARAGFNLSRRYFGVPDRAWLYLLGEAAIRRIPVLGGELSRRHRTRRLLARLFAGALLWRMTGERPAEWSNLSRRLFSGRRDPLPAGDGWIGERARFECLRGPDSQIRMTLASPLWPLAEPPRVRIRHHSTVLFDAALVRRGAYALAFPWPTNAGDELALTIECDRFFIPLRQGLSKDERKLSIQVLRG